MRTLFLIRYVAGRLGRSIHEHRVFFSLLSFNAVLYITNATFVPYLGAYYRGRGMSVSQIGILTAIGPLVALVMQPTWGILGDKYGRHMLALRIAIFGNAFAVLTFYGMSGFWGFAVAAAIFAVFNCGIQPLGDTITVGQIVRYGYRFATIRLGGTLGYAMAVIFAGRVLRGNPYASFGITSAVFLILALITFTIPVDSGNKPARGKLDFKALFQNKKILFIILFAFMFQTAIGFNSSFIGVYAIELGYDYSAIGTLMCVSAIAEVPVLLLIDRVMRRFSTELMLIVSGFFLVIRLIVPPLFPTFEGLVITQCFGGLTYMVMYYSAVMFINNNLAPELRGTGMAVLCVVQSGFASLFSNIIGGRLGENIGIGKTYLVYAAILFVFNTICAVIVFSKHVSSSKKSANNAS